MIHVTTFRDLAAREATASVLDFDTLAERIEHPREYPAKADCPLIKLGRFGARTTDRGSLRHDANILAVTGVEGDYDAGLVGIDEAAARLRLAGVTALLYTSPSHRPEAPRWRVLAPLSRDCLPRERRQFTARLNGVLGGILAPESFVLAQSYYIGRVAGSVYESRRIDGQYIDLLEELDGAAIDSAKNGTNRAERLDEIGTNNPVVRRLGERGLILRVGTDGKVEITCPFEREHTGGGGRGATVYFPPHTGGYERGHFKCLHSHCEGRPDDAFLRAIGLAEPPEQADDELPRPMPLPELPPVPDFPLEILPGALRDWVADAAERAQFPVAFAAVAAMVAMGAVVGRKIGIRLKARDDWTEYANVWGGAVGLPSSLKSPAMREALRPFRALQVAADAVHASAIEAHKAELDALRLRRDARRKAAAKILAKDPDAHIDLGNDSEPEAPVARAYWTSNANEASLGVLLEQNPNGLLIERDELSALLVSLEDDAKADLRGLMISGWSGKEGYRFDRIVRGKTFLPAFAVSVLGGIQPGPLARYVRGARSGEQDDGMLQRFQLFVWPDAGPFEHVDRYPRKAAKDAAHEAFRHAATFDPAKIGATDDYGDAPPFLRLSDEAQTLFNEWYVDFMNTRRKVEAAGEESTPLSSHFGKFPGLVGKLALIIHVLDDPAGKRVSRRTLLKALAWLDYLTPHARRVYHAIDCPETSAAKLLLARIRDGKLPKLFRARDIYRNCWHGLTDSETVKRACRLLFDYGWLIEIVDPGGGSAGGRPADPRYAVTPAAKEST